MSASKYSGILPTWAEYESASAVDGDDLPHHSGYMCVGADCFSVSKDFW